jgi:hypothetical protein
MKSTFLILLTAVLLAACGSRQEGADGTQTAQSDMTSHGAQTGTSAGTVSAEVIGSDMGYIVENARISGDQSSAVYSIKEVLRISKGTSTVLLVRTQTEGGATEFLAMEFPRFAEGTSIEYAAGEMNAAFWIFGMKGKTEVMKQTGAVEGTLQLLKTATSTANLGMQRTLTDGVGEMEVVVVGIDNEGLDIPNEKKYAARFTLPMITLDELVKLNQPI